MLTQKTCWGGLVAMVMAYALVQTNISELGRAKTSPELLVAMPVFAQVVLAGGDRHLAANLSGFRVLVAATERMTAEDYAVQARLQSEIARFNPAHEDNYYIAANILPWNGLVEPAADVLRRAAERRRFDWLPLFHLGFIDYHFRKNPAAGAAWLLQGVPRVLDQQDRWALENLAARWLERGYSTQVAAGMVESMAEHSPPGAFRKYLKVRAKRLQNLQKLKEAADAFRALAGRQPARLQDLIDAGLIDAVPEDPLGIGFEINPDGVPDFRKEQR